MHKSNKETKTSRQLERYFKGIANHRRIDILMLVSSSNNITLESIAKELDCNLKTISGHTHKLVQAGLLNKKYIGRTVIHSLSPYGKVILKLITEFNKATEQPQ